MEPVHGIAQTGMGGAQRFPRNGDLPESDRPHGLELAAAVVCPARVRDPWQGCVAIYQMIISTSPHIPLNTTPCMDFSHGIEGGS